MSIKEEQLIVKVVFFSSIVDVLVRCLMMDFVQFNGKYGCFCCLFFGEIFVILVIGNFYIYFYKFESNEGYDKLRIKEEIKVIVY